MQNEDLFQPNTTVLKRNLLEDLDYALVPHEVYKHFADIYEGGPEITRNVCYSCYVVVPFIYLC